VVRWQEWARRFSAVAALVLADQWSKGAVFRWIPVRHQSEPLSGEWLAFCNSCNPGAAFGQLADYPLLLVVGRAVAVLFLSGLLLRAPARPRLGLVAMTLVLAGALGNLIDNLWTGCAVPGQGFPFGVRDFIDVWYQPFLGIDRHFPAFNVADSCITVGACVWILAGFLHRPTPAPAPAAPTGPDGPA